MLATTLYSSVTLLLNAMLLMSAALLYFLPRRLGSQRRLAKPPTSTKHSGNAQHRDQPDPLPIRPFITAYRGGMLIITCLAILAVDFRVFPRRFAKVENWGTSLMDMGVGSFVFSAGLVSSRPILKARLAGEKPSLSSVARSSLRSSTPLLALGAIRLYSVKGLDYAEHVTEYGVHWNFFFTLAFLPPFGVLIPSVFGGQFSIAFLSLISGCIYQALLQTTSLQAYILTAPRTDLLSQNREGVFSFCGYLAIFLAGQAIGFRVFLRDVGSTPKQQRWRLLLTLVLSSILCIFLFVFATSRKYGFGLRVSRRLANLPYILWVSAFNTAQITVYCLIETLSFPDVYLEINHVAERRESDKASSRVIKAYNRNGLAVFLLANLSTGLINMTLDTLAADHVAAMTVLLGYAGLLTTVAVALDHWDISIKL